MAKRGNVTKYPTLELQGEDSYVVLKAVKVSEIRAARKASETEPDFDDFEGGIEMARKHVVGWNWVGDDGNPLPLPKDEPKVMSELTTDEITFIVNLLVGGGKN